MYEKPRIVKAKGRVIEIAHLELPFEPATYLTSAVAATGTTLTVADNAGFANTYPLLIGELGQDKTEIKKVNAVVSAGTSLTSTAMTFAHPINTKVRRLLFDQWRIYGNSTNTTTGATLIATIDMQVRADFTSYVNAGTEYSYYFALPYDSLNSVAGDTYSDGIANETQYASNTVAKLIKQSLKSSKTKMGGDITNEFLLDEINDCLRYMSGQLKRWSCLQSFDYALGATSRGINVYTLPSDMEDVNSNKSVLGIRIGDDENLLYRDKREWEEELDNVNHTQVRTQAVATDTSLDVDNSYDFADSGSVDVFVSGTKYTLTYTGVTRSLTAGVLTGIPATGTGAITVTTAVDIDVWQSETEGMPLYYTIYDGKLYIWPLPNGTYDNKVVWLDYYTSRTAVDSDADTVEFPRYDAVKHWLCWKLRAQKNSKGELNPQDTDYLMFQQILQTMVIKEVNGQKHKMYPRINKLSL